MTATLEKHLDDRKTRARTDDPHPREPLRAEGVAPERPADEPVTRAATLLPPELLQPSEIIVLLLKPSPWFILLASLASLAAIGLATTAALAIQRFQPIGLTREQIMLAGIGLAALRLSWQFLEWLSRVYVLTDQRVIRVRGVIRISVFEAPLHRIQHTNLDFSLRERLFFLGTILFSTAGTGFPEAAWSMVANPLDVHQTVVRTINRYRRS